jgi:5-bromo-4-chloroindolyl phosphate hydrolysis protein
MKENIQINLNETTKNIKGFRESFNANKDIKLLKQTEKNQLSKE